MFSLSFLWAILPKKWIVAIMSIGIILLGIWTAYAVHERSVKRTYFAKGAAFVRDSAREAEIVKALARRDSLRLRADTLASRASANAPPHLTLSPISDKAGMSPHGVVDTIAVTVDSTTWRLPAVAALDWQRTDSSATLWHAAYTAEHAVRVVDDSIITLLSQRPVSTTDTVRVGHSWRGYAVALAAGGALVKFGPQLVRALAHHR